MHDHLSPEAVLQLALREARQSVGDPLVQREIAEGAYHEWALSCCQGREPGNLEAWLRTVVRNRRARILSRAHARAVVDLDQLATPREADGDDAREARRFRLDASLPVLRATLTPRQRSVLDVIRTLQSVSMSARHLGMTRREVRRVIRSIARKARKIC